MSEFQSSPPDWLYWLNVDALKLEQKRILVERLKPIWPTIDSDLSDASTNGLSARAKAGERGWIEAEARAWAEENRRLLKA